MSPGSPGILLDVPVSSSVTFDGVLGTFNLNPGQWFQFIGLWGNCLDGDDLGELSFSELTLFVQLGSVTIFQFSKGIPDNPLGALGASLGVPESALFSLNDYLQEPGTSGLVTLGVGSRVTNADALNTHQAIWTGGSVVEVYNSLENLR